MELILVDNWGELKERMPHLQDDSFVAVEGLIFDKNYRWILHRRGPKCRDEQYKLEGIGGRIDAGESFLHALEREIEEEVGVEANIKPIGILEIRNDTVYDNRLKRNVTWVIISFLCCYYGGDLLRMEPEKNLGYEKFDLSQVSEDELSSSSKAAYKMLINNWIDIKELLDD